MKSFKMALAGIVLLFSLASAQFTPGPVPVCPEPLSNGGSDYLSHEKYCQLFYRCVDRIRYTFTCGLESLFDPARICDYPGTATCVNWPCDTTRNGTKYPDVCGDKYFQCTGTGYVMMTCASGQRFDVTSGNCMPGVPDDDAMCSKRVKNDSATCNHRPDPLGDMCKYVTVDGNITHTDRPCPDKTAFNATTCGCTTLNDNCPKPVFKAANKLPDNACRASFRVDFRNFFTNGAIRAFSDKISAELNDTIQATGVMVSNGVATLVSTESAKAQLYLYVYNSNELTRNTGFIITFRSLSATTTPIILLTNNFNEACIPTLNVTATFTGSSYTVTVYAQFMTRNSQTNITYVADTISATLAVAATSFLEVIVTHDTNLQLKLTDKGSTGTTTGTSTTATGVINLGAAPTFAYNKCGMTVARGLTGVLNGFSVHEGCRNATRLMNM